jgi:hypothetical protein
MATVKKHPGVSNYHMHYDVGSGHDRRAMIESYESGKIVLLQNCGFAIDFDLFDRIDIPGHPDKFIQYLIAKLSMTDYLDILWGDEEAFGSMIAPPFRRTHPEERKESGYQALKQYLRSTTFASPELRIGLVRQMQSFQKDVLDLFERVFPEYTFSDYSINWRLTESRGESLHVDAYRTEKDFHQVKLFVNLDSAPRIWNTGEQMKTLVSRHYRDFGMDRYIGFEYHRFLEECDRVLFDPLNGPRDCLQTHTTFFDRGDVWIAETRQIPHQIFFGRKMVSVQFYIPPEQRVFPETSMLNFVNSLKETSGRTSTPHSWLEKVKRRLGP